MYIASGVQMSIANKPLMTLAGNSHQRGSTEKRENTRPKNQSGLTSGHSLKDTNHGSSLSSKISLI